MNQEAEVVEVSPESTEPTPELAAAPVELPAAHDGESSAVESGPSEGAGEAGEAEQVGENAAELSIEDLVPVVEAILFTSGEPIGSERIAEVTGAEEENVKLAIVAIQSRYAADTYGFELLHIAERYQFRTKGKFGSFVRELRAGKPQRLSNAALETLSIVAYRQPVVKSDIEKIRGVDATPTLKTLVERSLIRIVGHQSSVGQPALYGTTDDFLKLFGMSSLAELPTLRDIRELEREPGELEEGSEPESNDKGAIEHGVEQASA